MKKFLIKLSYTVLPVWLLLVGLATYLWMTDDKSGDLMRLGLIDTGPEYSDSIRANLLPQVYFNSIDNDSALSVDTCDVLVIGDSFSHGGGVGKLGDYVNCLAHDSQRSVVLYTPQDPTLSSPMQIAYDVLDLGLIDSTHVTNLVVQEVERYIVSRHCGFRSDPNRTILSSGTQAAQQPATIDEKRQDVKLSSPMFGGKAPDRLYFYNEDVILGIDVDSAQRQQVVNCYRHVIDKARERGVNLVLLVACDKYDMYQDFIVDNPYPAKTLNEDIQRWMSPGELDCFVFAKDVLHPLLEQRVRDVYLFNDTHWSPASSHIIAREVINKLK